MSLRGYTQNRILARLAAQDREEMLARQRAQNDAANRVATMQAIERLTGIAGQIPDAIAAEQGKQDAKLMEEALLRADVYDPNQQMDIESFVDPGEGGDLPGQNVPDPDEISAAAPISRLSSSPSQNVAVPTINWATEQPMDISRQPKQGLSPVKYNVAQTEQEFRDEVKRKRDAFQAKVSNIRRLHDPVPTAPAAPIAKPKEEDFEDMPAGSFDLAPTAPALPGSIADQAMAGFEEVIREGGKTGTPLVDEPSTYRAPPGKGPATKSPADSFKSINFGAGVGSGPSTGTKSSAAPGQEGFDALHGESTAAYRARLKQMVKSGKMTQAQYDERFSKGPIILGSFDKFPTAAKAYNRAIELSNRLEKTEPNMAKKLKDLANKLLVSPEVTANMEELEKMTASAERLVPTERVRMQMPGAPAPQKTDETLSATKFYQEKQADADKKVSSPPAASSETRQVVRKYVSTLDENLEKAGVKAPGIIKVDAAKVAEELVSEIVDGAQVQEDSLAGMLRRFLGQNPSPRAIKVAKLAAQKRIQDRQAKAREEMFVEAEKRTKLDEQRGVGGYGARGKSATSAADYAKYIELEAAAAVETIIGKMGPQLMEVAKIEDPAARAQAVQKILTVDTMPPGLELNSRDKIVGRIISDINEFGEDFFKSRKTKEEKTKESPLISDKAVQELASTRQAYENLSLADPSERAALNQALTVASTVAPDKVVEVVKQNISRDAKATAADAKIRRNIAAYLKATSGLAATDSEYERIHASAPNENDRPDVYYSKLNDFLREIAAYHDRMLEYQTKSGRSPGGIAPIGKVNQFSVTGRPISRETQDAIKRAIDETE